MTYIKNFGTKHSVLMSVLISACFQIVLRLTSFTVKKTVPNYGYLHQMIADGIVACFGIALIIILVDYKVLTRRGSGFFNGISTGGFIVILSCFGIIGNIVQANNLGYSIANPARILIYLLAMFCVGAAEELIFRGTISNLMRNQYGTTKKGIWFSVLLSSVLFGSMHFFNMLSGVSFTSALMQVIGASAIGAVLTAIYYRTDNIWSVVFLHALIDFSSLLLTGVYSQGNLVTSINSYTYTKLIGVIPYAICLVFLLRNSKMEEILKRENN